MTVLSYEQGVAATRIENTQRVQWAAKGLHILKRDGKRKWMPALNDRQVEDAKLQLELFLKRRSGMPT